MHVISEWGLSGVKALMDQADAFIIVDVLSFSTCIDVACTNGAQVFPFPIHDRNAAEEAAMRRGAELAGKRSDTASKYSLSAPTLQAIPAGTRLVLPSPNGSHISYAAREKVVLAGCLRNAFAVAEAAREQFGAGAIISKLGGTLSAEAIVARDAFLSARSDLSNRLMESVSGIELREKGFPQDVDIALELNVSTCVPILTDEAFVAAG